jgi:hypothetical protein
MGIFNKIKPFKNLGHSLGSIGKDIGKGFDKFGKGANKSFKRFGGTVRDIGKFAGGQIDKLTSGVTDITGMLSSPIFIIGVVLIGGVVLISVLKK